MIRTVYSGPKRVALAMEDVVVHVELNGSHDGWIEIRRSGTGGPLSGILITRYESGIWSAPIPEDLGELVKAALSALDGHSEGRGGPSI